MWQFSTPTSCLERIAVDLSSQSHHCYCNPAQEILDIVTPIEKSWQIPMFLKPVFKPGIKKLGLDTASGNTQQTVDYRNYRIWR
jgi:hypothetical protein